jgi:alkylation response protein AidB-like acyl-CoA dehydrogenase
LKAILPEPRHFHFHRSQDSRQRRRQPGRAQRRQNRRHRAQDGHQGSATATLNFGEDGNCIGELLGNEREGIKIMFMMMNEARLGTGMQGLVLSSAALEHAVQYAKERVQGTAIWEMKNPDAKP